MREIAIKSIIAFLLLAARVASAQGTTTFLSNIGQSSSGSLSVGSDSWIAGGFVTGTNASGYLLDSIQLGMANSTGTPSDFTVMLYEMAASAGGSSPGSSLGTFVGSLDPTTSGTYTYNLPGGLMLSTRATYFIVVTAGTPEATGAYQWSDTGANNYNPTAGFFSIGAILDFSEWILLERYGWQSSVFADWLVGTGAGSGGIAGDGRVGDDVVDKKGARREAWGTREKSLKFKVLRGWRR